MEQTQATKQFKDEKHKEKIIDRIKKLLNHAEGTPYEAEADTAMKMAQSYMRQFGLSLSAIQLKEQLEEAIIKENSNHNKRRKVDRWEVSLAVAVATVFDCKVVTLKRWKESTIQFIGYTEDIAICKEIFKLLHSAAKAAAYREFPRTDKHKRKSFLLGVTLRLRQRADEEKQKDQQSTGSYALVVVEKEKRVDDWMDKNMRVVQPKKTRRSSVDLEAFHKGRQHANSMDLNNRTKIS